MNEAAKQTVQSRYRAQMRADIAHYAPHDREAVLAFRHAMYGPASIFADPAYVQWLYEDGERTSDGGAPFWIYRKGGKIEAHQGGMRTALKIGAEEHDGLWLFDLMVSPPFRLRGVGVLLAEMASETARVALGLEVSDAARKALMRADWLDLGSVPLYIRPLDLVAVARRHGQKGLRRGGGYAGNVVLRASEWLGLAWANAAGLRMEEVTQFDERVDQIWASAAPFYPVLCRRDRHYLNWRFAHFPYADRYRCFLFSRDQTPVGYAVLRVGEHNGLRAGYVVDFLCPPRWTYALLARCLQILRRQRVQIVYCLHLNPVAGAAFSALGFVRRPSRWPLMIHARDLSPQAVALIRDPRNWFLTAGDSDADRPREGTIFADDPSQASSS